MQPLSFKRFLFILPASLLTLVFMKHFWDFFPDSVTTDYVPLGDSKNMYPEEDLTDFRALSHSALPPQPSKLAKIKSWTIGDPLPRANVTLIAIWRAGSKALYLPNFFASIAANDPSIDLLFIKFYKEEETGDGRTKCAELAPDVPNVREVCLEHEEYMGMHADFLCAHWGCVGEDRKTFIDEMRRRSTGDDVNSFFRILRSGVFAKWINPQNPLWGWCDMDTIMGSFERAFPMELASMFDVFVPTPPFQGDSVLLFTPGHLTIFNAQSPTLLGELLRYPAFLSLQAYLTEPPVSRDSEEVEYSNYIFLNPNITFFRGLRIIHAQHHVSSPTIGSFGIGNARLFCPHVSAVDSKLDSYETNENTDLRADTLAKERIIETISRRIQNHRDVGRPPLFTPQGYEYQVELREGQFPYFLWFPQRFSIDYVATYGVAGWGQGKGFRYTMRRAMGGPVTERAEPSGNLVVYPKHLHETLPDGSPNPAFDAYNEENSPYLVDALYTHFQIEKHQDWWNLPPQAIGSDDLLYTDLKRGMQIWDKEGEVVFDTEGGEELVSVSSLVSHRKNKLKAHIVRSNV